MMQLTLDIKSSAEMMGTEPEAFLQFLEREQVEGVVKFNESWRVSIFALARLLGTKAETLLDLIEDYMLGQMIEDVEDDEWFERSERS